MSERVLITGSTGFVGSCLARAMLKDGHEVHVIVRKSSNLWRLRDAINDITIHHGDIIQHNSLIRAIKSSKPTVVYHLATYGGYPFQKDEEKIFKTNLTGTLNILKACPKNIEMFINTGSSSEYGLKERPMKEIDLLGPVNFYGASKAAVTLLCQSWSKEHDLPLVIFRLFSPYGYFEEPTRLIPQIIVSCLNERRPIVDTPDSVRDFIFIEDAVEAYKIVVKKMQHPRGEIINLGSGQQHTVREVVEKINEISEANLKPIYRNKPRSSHEPTTWVADISKAKKMLGWEPRNNIDNGLKKTIEWFKKNMGLYGGA